MNTDEHRSVFICVHLWFRFWLRLCCAVEFVASFFRASVSLWPMMHTKFPHSYSIPSLR